jgi:hypothetical protein
MPDRVDKPARPLQQPETFDLDRGVADDAQKLLVRPDVGLERRDVEIADRDHRAATLPFRRKPRRQLVEKLAAHHDAAGFDCGRPDLNQFLQRFAIASQQANSAQTYVTCRGKVVVGESTYRATRDAVDYRELEPVDVKGKAEPLRVWVVGSVRTEAPGRADEGTMPFVGRQREQHLLLELYEHAVRESSLQLVTIVGEPGIGKTRLVADLVT